VRSFGKSNVLRDIDTAAKRLGRSYDDLLLHDVGSSDVLVVVIGRSWSSITDDEGKRRLDSAADLLRREIAIALELGIPVIPVLVSGAKMPREEDLPDQLKPFSGKESVPLSERNYDADISLLVAGVREAARIARKQKRDKSAAVRNFRHLFFGKRLYWMLTAFVAGGLAIILIAAWLTMPSAPVPPNLYFIVDATERTRPMIGEVKNSIVLSVSAVDRRTRVGLRVYGGTREGATDCEESKQLLPIKDYENRTSEIESALTSLEPTGTGSLAYAVTQALEADLTNEDRPTKLIVITAGADPLCDATGAVSRDRLPATKSSVDFVLVSVGEANSSDAKLFQQYATALNGTYLQVNRATSLPQIVQMFSYYGSGYRFDSVLPNP
jgi:hypothetical protein